MHIIVLGAGVVGITTAYTLRAQGHEVTVVERQDNAALETSFANGGQIAAAHADPWANPVTPFKALKWLGEKEAPLLFHLAHYDPALWAWSLKFLQNCTNSRTAINTERTLRVALYSRQKLKSLRQQHDFAYNHQEKGILHFYRNPKEYQHALKAAETMRRFGLDRQALSPKECVTVEPSLKTISADLQGGIYSPQDESGDAHQFTQQMAALCRQMGVSFHYETTANGLDFNNHRLAGIKTDKGTMRSDGVVVCLGSFSAPFLAPYGLKLPIYPAKGYSLTLPLREGVSAPFVSLTDDEFKLVISRLGNHLRVAGTAELGGPNRYKTSLNPQRTQFILRKTLELFPNCGITEQASYWAGLRPKTPDSVPIIGKTAIESLYLNTGHGTLGWTMSCGSAQLISDIITGNKPEIDPTGLGLDRFR